MKSHLYNTIAICAAIAFILSFPETQAAPVSFSLKKLEDIQSPKPSGIPRLALSPSGKELLIQSIIENAGATGMQLDASHPVEARAKKIIKTDAVIIFNSDKLSLDKLLQPDQEGKWVYRGEIIPGSEDRDARFSFEIGKDIVAPMTDANGKIIRFENNEGDAIEPDMDLLTNVAYGAYCGAEGLFVIQNGNREEIPEARGFSTFTYDKECGRILVKDTPKGDILYELNTKKYQILPNFDKSIKAEKINYLIPGREAILTQTNWLNKNGDDYVDTALTLQDLSTGGIAELNLRTSASARKHFPCDPVCSKHLIAYNLDGVIRIYSMSD